MSQGRKVCISFGKPPNLRKRVIEILPSLLSDLEFIRDKMFEFLLYDGSLEVGLSKSSDILVYYLDKDLDCECELTESTVLDHGDKTLFLKFRSQFQPNGKGIPKNVSSYSSLVLMFFCFSTCTCRLLFHVGHW